jgi:hypothetical protein
MVNESILVTRLDKLYKAINRLRRIFEMYDNDDILKWGRKTAI